MKSPLRQRRVRSLRAKAAVMDSSAEFDDYGAEPNMKLSHAFMVVLALHVVAVGGLFAFNKVKAGHSKTSARVKSELAAAQQTVASEEKASPVTTLHEIEKSVAKIATPSQQPTKIVSAPVPPAKTTVPKAALAATVAAAPSVAATIAAVPEPSVPVSEPVVAQPAAATEYTIVKGDNPYKIAKRFHVPYDSLIKFNNITDPRKIQIGQKIRIPVATSLKTKQHG